MTSYAPNQYREILKIGSARYDIDNEDHSLDYQLPITLQSLRESEIISFLEYQIRENDYPNIYFMLIDGINLQMAQLGKEKETIILNWLTRKCGLQRIYKKKADTFFQEPGLSFDIDNWKYELSEFIYNRPLDEILDFFAYGKTTLAQGLKLHSIVCNSPINCAINDMFENLMYILDDLSVEVNELLETQDQERKPIVKMQWNGNQKQLAELFIVLKQKGWIENFENNTIKASFTNSNTIQQYLKPAQDRKTKENTYEQVFTPNYAHMFFGIKENPSLK